MTALHNPLLIFDSGIGGLSIFYEVRKTLPRAPIIYAADFAGLPYGEKSEAEISARVPALLGRLVERFRPQMAVIACNTASTIALSHVRGALDITVVGTVPAIKPAAEQSQSRVIGLLGTQATIRQPYVDKLAADFASDALLLRHGAPQLVMAAEMLLKGETPDESIFDSAIAPLVAQDSARKMDRVVLACTHFPLVQEQLGAAFLRSGYPIGQIHFVDGAKGIARRVKHLS